MDKKKTSKKKLKYIFLIIAVVIVGGLLAYAFSSFMASGETNVVRNEITYFILIALLVLPVLLLVLLFALAFGKKKIDDILTEWKKAKSIVESYENGAIPDVVA